MLQVTGTTILLAIIGIWIVALWTGWLMLFSADPGSVVDTHTREPADLTSRIYFTGYTIFTLGIGNFTPKDGLWEVLTAVASLNGLFLITLSITYLVPIVSAAVEERRIAAVIADLGHTPHGILIRAWNGEGFTVLSTAFSQIVPMIELHAQRHLAYPVLHYFHSPHRRTAVSPGVAALAEAMLLLTAGVKPSARPPEIVTASVDDAIAGLLETIRTQYIEAGDETPPLPNLKQLAEAGIPVVESRVFEEEAHRRDEIRRLLKAFVEDDGWRWKDVDETAFE